MSRQPPRPLQSASPHAGQLEAHDLANYIAEMSGELAVLARRAGSPLTAYFLDMARIESQAHVEQKPSTPNGKQPKER